ncbi:topology modulation protein [Neobacillus sp. D3-1R]|uniref:topology modulation protein n=1 Tax=Neobacillus sp. D3-1R TaxID=3445778 RepID=UPI003FA0AD6E
MRKIMVIGVSSGVGKTTFSLELGKVLGIKVYHLDALFWKPGWVESSLEEFSAAQEKILQLDEWIMEGNYSNTFNQRMEHADTMIYLELPLYVCLYRVLKRWVQNFGKTRPDVGEGCTEKIDWAFIKFIMTTHGARKEKMLKRLRVFGENGDGRKTYILKNKKEVGQFLLELKEGVSTK